MLIFFMQSKTDFLFSHSTFFDLHRYFHFSPFGLKVLLLPDSFPLSHLSPSFSRFLLTTVLRARVLLSAASCLTKGSTVFPLCISFAANLPPSSTPLWYIPFLSPGAFLIDLHQLRSPSVSRLGEGGSGPSPGTRFSVYLIDVFLKYNFISTGVCSETRDMRKNK